ncbi:MAG: endonuclease III [Candidatus Nanohaloarchaea archaeon]|nr:endonuclease III [Candidatus Nanohaloarchaea archaeon]
MDSDEFVYDEAYSERLGEVMDRLRDFYGVPERESREDPVDSLITTILSQNTNDDNRDVAKERLEERFDGPAEILAADVDEVAEAVKPAGLGPTKAERIRTFLRMLKEERGKFSLDHVAEMEPDDAEEYLQRFPGVGPKTAAVTLCFVFGMPVFPVDTHVYRVSKRLGLIPEDVSRERAHKILDREVPDDRKYEFHINLIKHGRRFCTARNPSCQEGPIGDLCEYCSCREGRDEA